MSLKSLFVSVCFMVLGSASCVYSYSLTPQQDSLSIEPSYKASVLLEDGKKEEVIAYCNREIKTLLEASIIDSLEVAELYKYQNKAHYQLKAYLESVKAIEKAISYCNETEEGRLLKGQLYSDKASAYNYTEKDKATFNTTLNAIKYLRSVKNVDYDYLITSYRYLSEQCAYHGNFEEAKQYLRQAETLYKNHKDELDRFTIKNYGRTYRYDLILLYSRVYQMYKFGKSANYREDDSLDMVGSIDQFEKLHNEARFNVKNDGVYYVAALGHMGDWYASRKPESQTTKADLDKAHYYLDKVIDLIENKGYKGDVETHKYNKVKALALYNRLDEADALMSGLTESLSETDGRKPYFLAQKALVKAKQKQKDKAINIFYQALTKVHSDTTVLEDDFKNFKPSLNYGHTKLLLRLAEELNRFFPEDSSVTRKVANLYPAAFLQFENSYDKRKFNKTQKTYLNQIIKGLLKTKRLGYNQDTSLQNILNRYENIQNLLAWQKFNQNRQFNNFPELDSLRYRNYELRSLIADAKSQNQKLSTDSLQLQLSQTQKYTSETYPSLSLFNASMFKIEDLQNQLTSDQLVVKYIIFEDELAIYNLTKTDVRLEIKPWTKSDKQRVINFTEAVKTQNFNTASASALAQLLLPKISDDITHVIINPDAELYRLPFEILKQNNRHFVEEYTVSYTSNLMFINPDIAATNVQDKLAIYVPDYGKAYPDTATRSSASNLIGAKQEAESISVLFPSTIYTGQSLTKQDFVNSSKNAKILHLAMHAEVNNEEPSLSKLLFSNNNKTTDNLYLEELYGLKLSADLAVLSACNTGVGKVNAGRSLESFQRAFTFAGVPATVASLWEVPDAATKQIILGFYQNLSNGQSKSNALQAAKTDYLSTHRGTKLAEPYFWAGFVVYGKDAPIVEKPHDSITLYIILTVGLIAFFILFFSKRKASQRS